MADIGGRGRKGDAGKGRWCFPGGGVAIKVVDNTPINCNHE